MFCTAVVAAVLLARIGRTLPPSLTPACAQVNDPMTECRRARAACHFADAARARRVSGPRGQRRTRPEPAQSAAAVRDVAPDEVSIGHAFMPMRC